MVDWVRLEELANDLGHDDFDEVFELFLEEVEEKLGGLVVSSQISEDLHFLKGSAENLGFETFRLACQHAEKTNDPTDIAAVVPAYEASKSNFAQGRAAHFAAA